MVAVMAWVGVKAKGSWWLGNSWAWCNGSGGEVWGHGRWVNEVLVGVELLV